MFYRVRNRLRELLCSRLVKLYSYASSSQLVTVRVTEWQAVAIVNALAEVLCRRYEKGLTDRHTVEAFNVVRNSFTLYAFQNEDPLYDVWEALDMIRRRNGGT